MNLTCSNIAHLCSQVDLTSDRPVIDLSQITFFEPFALIYLGMFLRHHNSHGRAFNLTAPASPQAREYMARQNFWARFNFTPEEIKKENLRRFTTSTSLNDIIDIEQRPYIAEDVGDAVLKLLVRNGVRVRAGIVAEMAAELVDNFAQHADRPLAACLVQYYPRSRRVAFAICDCGIGIRASLSSNPKYAHLAGLPHREAAMRAFEPLVSRKAEGGMGLTEVKESTLCLGGRVFLATGDAYVTIESANASVGRMGYELPGVQIELSFSQEV
jgi:hypothetical protein